MGRPSRSAELRDRNRRILVWSFAGAVLIHIVVFAMWPETPIEPLGEFGATTVTAVEEEGVFLEIRVEFGGPEIVSSGGRADRRRVARTLETRRLTRMPVECRDAMRVGRTYDGEVRLVVDQEGRVDRKDMVVGSGDACGDRALLAVAGDLWYRWLPSEEHPAPIVLIQPVSVAGAEG